MQVKVPTYLINNNYQFKTKLLLVFYERTIMIVP